MGTWTNVHTDLAITFSDMSVNVRRLTTPREPGDSRAERCPPPFTVFFLSPPAVASGRMAAGINPVLAAGPQAVGLSWRGVRAFEVFHSGFSPGKGDVCHVWFLSGQSARDSHGLPPRRPHMRIKRGGESVRVGIKRALPMTVARLWFLDRRVRRFDMHDRDGTATDCRPVS